MTNAEKYKEVFGMDADPKNCPTLKCDICPCSFRNEYDQVICNRDCRAWWLDEYKGNDTVKVEVTEVHTFAKPDDVSDIDFPSSGSEDK